MHWATDCRAVCHVGKGRQIEEKLLVLLLAMDVRRMTSSFFCCAIDYIRIGH